MFSSTNNSTVPEDILREKIQKYYNDNIINIKEKNELEAVIETEKDNITIDRTALHQIVVNFLNAKKSSHMNNSCEYKIRKQVPVSCTRDPINNTGYCCEHKNVLSQQHQSDKKTEYQTSHQTQ